MHDVAVSPDGHWAVTAGAGSEVLRWDIDPSSGHWYGRQSLRGHTGDVVGLELAAAGEQLSSVSIDPSAIIWDMRPAGGRASGPPADLPGPGLQTPAAWRGATSLRPSGGATFRTGRGEPTCSDCRDPRRRPPAG